MSIRPTPGFEAELRVSPALVAAALVASGAALTLAGLLLSLPVSVLLFGLLLYALAALIWALDHLAPFAGRWFTLLALSIAAALAHGWLAVPGALAFMAVPSTVGVAVIGLGAGTGLAAAQSLVFLLLATSRIGGIEADSLITPLVLTWAMLGVLAAVYGGAEHLARWSWVQTRRAQELLEEARDRRAELRQALYLSFFRQTGLGAKPVFTGLGNYANLLSDERFLKALGNTTYYAAGSIFIIVPAALGLALLLTARNLKLREFFRLFFFSPIITSGVVVAIIFALVFDERYGLINNYILLPLGLERVRWLLNPAAVMPAIIIMGLWRYGCPWRVAPSQSWRSWFSWGPGTTTSGR